jgi:hypothetical protein
MEGRTAQIQEAVPSDNKAASMVKAWVGHFVTPLKRWYDEAD